MATWVWPSLSLSWLIGKTNYGIGDVETRKQTKQTKGYTTACRASLTLALVLSSLGEQRKEREGEREKRYSHGEKKEKAIEMVSSDREEKAIKDKERKNYQNQICRMDKKTSKQKKYVLLYVVYCVSKCILYIYLVRALQNSVSF